MSITFEVDGIPKGQPRPRAFSIHGKARVYSANTAEAWKSAIALAAKPHRPKAPIECPVSVSISHFMPRPKSHYGKRGLKENAPTVHASKPDVDNLLKAALDALTSIGYWRDDAQVWHTTVTKIYGDFSGATITISTEDHHAGEVG